MSDAGHEEEVKLDSREVMRNLYVFPFRSQEYTILTSWSTFLALHPRLAYNVLHAQNYIRH